MSDEQRDERARAEAGCALRKQQKASKTMILMFLDFFFEALREWEGEGHVGRRHVMSCHVSRHVTTKKNPGSASMIAFLQINAVSHKSVIGALHSILY